MAPRRESDLANKPSTTTPKMPNRRREVGFTIGYIAAMLAALWLFQVLLNPMIQAAARDIPYSEFRTTVKAGRVVDVSLGSPRITGHMKNAAATSEGDRIVAFRTVAPPADPKLLDDLETAGVKYDVIPPTSSIGPFFLSFVLPMLLIGWFWYAAYRRMSAGAGGILGVGKSKATEVQPADVGVTFKDVGGADEAIAELREIIQFLKTPDQFARLGGRIPKGVLLVGPPGTGKTLIAKATAGEAQVPFFEASGSEFIEMFVGVGAARVRDLFDQARRAAPAIVFIDEIDAIGQSRAGAVRVVMTNDEREQTLNQLLAEIDGFKADAARPVIIMAATNRPEILDPALLRAGRFDRQVALGNPDLIGRVQILRIHTRAVRLAAEFDVDRAARMTPGFSGADLANAVNEAALLAARRNADAVALTDFEAAMERIIAGLEHRTRVMNDQERRAVACHECGHALVAQLVAHADPVGKVSIVPRSRGALGYTLQMPTEDRYLLTVEELQDRLAVMLGGRAAEKLTFQTISTGATDDIQRATDLARRMVLEFGMSEKLGSIRYAGQQLQYLGGNIQEAGQLSPHTQEMIDREVQRIVTLQYERAQQILAEHRTALNSLTEQLLKTETLDGSVVRQAVEGSNKRLRAA